MARAAELENPKMMGMLLAFTDLISFRLQQIELIDKTEHTMKGLSRKLNNTLAENRQYMHVSSQTLQEPLRKLRIFSGLIVNSVKAKEFIKAENYVLKIQSNVERFSNLLLDLSNFADLEDNSVMQPINLQLPLPLVISELTNRIDEQGGNRIR